MLEKCIFSSQRCKSSDIKFNASKLKGPSFVRSNCQHYISPYFPGSNLYAAEWLIWPPAQFINFSLLPTRYRVAFDNLVSLGFDGYTSYIKHRKRERSASPEPVLRLEMVADGGKGKM